MGLRAEFTRFIDGLATEVDVALLRRERSKLEDKIRFLEITIDGLGEIIRETNDRDRWRNAALKMAPAAGGAYTPYFVLEEIERESERGGDV